MSRRPADRSVAEAFSACLFVLAFFSSCAGQPSPSAGAVIQGSRFSLRLVPGPSYRFVSWASIFPIAIYPQVACWLETPQGEYVDTIYVTSKSSKKSWVSAPPVGRPEALPVWSHLAKARSPAVDAVTGATPAGATLRTSSLASALPSGTYIVKLEVNRSYDYNDTYTRANSGVTGQPSLVYKCALDVGHGPRKGTFEPIGTGAVDGSDGAIRPGLGGVTTALRILAAAEISSGMD